MEPILVTGGSGFIAAHAIARLLREGRSVRTTVRNPARAEAVLAMLAQAGVDPDGRLAFHQADLTDDAGWADAVHGCAGVLHVASPFPERLPRHPDELIVPARDGALRVLRAARDAGVRRVVLTSSFAAVGYGHPDRDAPYDETSWTDLHGPGISPYIASKTLAERATWDFVAREGGGLELSVVNPVGVFGPVLGADFATSVLLVQRLMDGALPGCPRLQFGVVDVRDVVDLHLRALHAPAAAGERFVATAGDFLWVREMAIVLRERLGAAARRVPTRVLPDWLVRLASLADPAVRQILPELGRCKNASSDKARRLLGWSPRSAGEALVATAESLHDQGLLRR